MSRSVVVTGMGVVSRDVIGIPAFCRLLSDGSPVPGRPTQFDSDRFRAKNAYATDPDVTLAALRRALSRSSKRLGLTEMTEPEMNCAGYSMLAAIEAVEQAGLTSDILSTAGCSIATTSGGMMDRFTDALEEGDHSVEFQELVSPGSAAVVLQRVLGLHGPLSSFSCACASSIGALSYAFMRIRNGDAPVMLVGGNDRIREADFAGFNALRAMDRERCRPFDVDRRGMIIGDGAAILVVEDEEHARARGAQPLAKVSSIALSTDSHHITCPKPDGLTRAMGQALERANLSADAVGYVNCHGTGTQINDEAEAIALEAVFGGSVKRPIVSSTKGTTGHLLGSAGAIEAVATILALRAGEAPQMTSTINPEDIPFTMPVKGQDRTIRTNVAMSNSLGFGGLNGSVIFALPETGDI
ncbi:beta-ketoacyl-[acyl-carrier-protein] synthase family protein [Litoreibacter janthinus]|uniref:Nodulation protein E n=1 Tax=Litoreibacter janthinus TaxID=670154 RepID=A0A1I6GD52_9RHOB|nr:beta-ketoacyl-[acyl-carrier-protein] synthase family protein [Litoreibacter janthinus]SFR40115.1 3-oxoacyl-[acyl-carrier-protein] synthase II [Litoreibacter janthinus]